MVGRYLAQKMSRAARSSAMCRPPFRPTCRHLCAALKLHLVEIVDHKARKKLAYHPDPDGVTREGVPVRGVPSLRAVAIRGR